MWLCRSGTFLVTHFIFLCFVGIETLDLDLYIEFKSPVQSGFFAIFGRKPDWTALGWFLDRLKTSPKWLQPVFQKTGPKPVKTAKKPVCFAFY